MNPRVSQSMKAVRESARTPWLAYPFAVLMFAAWGAREFSHLIGKEPSAHSWTDWIYLGLGIIALPPLRDLLGVGGLKALALYRAYRKAKP